MYGVGILPLVPLFRQLWIANGSSGRHSISQTITTAMDVLSVLVLAQALALVSFSSGVGAQMGVGYPNGSQNSQQQSNSLNTEGVQQQQPNPYSSQQNMQNQPYLQGSLNNQPGSYNSQGSQSQQGQQPYLQQPGSYNSQGLQNQQGQQPYQQQSGSYNSQGLQNQQGQQPYQQQPGSYNSQGLQNQQGQQPYQQQPGSYNSQGLQNQRGQSYQQQTGYNSQTGSYGSRTPQRYGSTSQGQQSYGAAASGTGDGSGTDSNTLLFALDRSYPRTRDAPSSVVLNHFGGESPPSFVAVYRVRDPSNTMPQHSYSFGFSRFGPRRWRSMGDDYY